MDKLESMKVFSRVVEQGSFVSAANELGITGTMVGLHIQSLEKLLGVRLLNRTTRRQNLTEFGLFYYEKCKQILLDISLAEAMAENQSQEPRGLLRIVSPVSFGVHAISPILEQYRAEFPDVSVDLLLSDRPLDMIDERADIMIKIGELQNVFSVIARPLMPYRSVICASPAYLEQNAPVNNPADLGQHRCLGFAHPVAGSEWLLQGPEGPISVPVNLVLSANNGEALRMAALNGMGIIMQPEILLAEDLKSGALRPILQNYAPLPKPIHLLTQADRTLTPKLRTFIDFLLVRFAARKTL